MTTDSRKWLAPAKLNLFLHIVGRRADGYHLLQTVFQFIDLCDELSFKVREDGIIRRDYSLTGVDESSDLTIKAAKLLQSRSDCSLGANIQMLQRIPMGGGLGGGSSDAATVLVALNRLWHTGLDHEQLLQLALQLGADVPVFVKGQAAWGEGVGEQLTALEKLPEPWYLLIVPGVAVATAEVFSHQDLTRNTDTIKIRDFLQGAGVNVCEPVVFRLYPEVARAASWLGQFGQARMSGTGASVFCRFDSKADAQKALAEKPNDWQGFVVKGLNCSPLRIDGLE